MLNLLWAIYALCYYIPRIYVSRTTLDVVSLFVIPPIAILSAKIDNNHLHQWLATLISTCMSFAYLIALSANTIFDLSLLLSMGLWLMVGIFRILSQESCNRLTPMV